MSNRAIAVSIVVAAEHAGRSLGRCLAALAQQAASMDIEIIVTDASGEAAGQYSRHFPQVRFILLMGADVPRLWSEGLAQSTGRIAALTIAECTPSPSWLKHLVAAHAAPWAAIGGAIDLLPRTGMVDWAVYFCRYSRYMPPLKPAFCDDLAGDNCSYKRSALDELDLVTADGFWESFVHRKMRSRGDELFLNPSSIVFFGGSFGCLAFLKRRFLHGRYFAARQAAHKSVPERLLRTVAFPAVTLLMLGRIVQSIFSKRRNRARLIAAMPVLLAFLLAWCLGEAVGYSIGIPRAGTRPTWHKSKEASSVG